jgi:hypothetical protein
MVNGNIGDGSGKEGMACEAIGELEKLLDVCG